MHAIYSARNPFLIMSTVRPPSIDSVAANRWAERPIESAQPSSPWLHEEVARRMEARLAVIVQQPQSWVHWHPLQGGMQAHAMLTNRYPGSQCYIVEDTTQHSQHAKKLLTPAWWRAERWRNHLPEFEKPAQPCNMVWANMALHMSADPFALLERWNSMLAVDGFVMFSCLGPDTLLELRKLYAQKGWPPPSHEFTDMHDWGDMLVQAGFAEPVMDMERIRLTFSSPDNMLAELRQLGRNLHTRRHPGLRGRAWRAALYHAIGQQLQDSAENGRLSLTFEIIYGHAFKPVPRIKMQPQTTLSLEQMQLTLRESRLKIKK